MSGELQDVARKRGIELLSSQEEIKVLVLGAAGVVGFGICDAWLKEEDVTVFAVDKDSSSLKNLTNRLGLDDSSSSRLVTIVGDFSSNETGKVAKDAIDAALNGQKITHVASAMGCTTPAPSGITSSDALTRLKDSYEQVFYPNLIATALFLDSIRDTEGASFTVAGGPFTHHCPNPELYNTSMMGATMNHFGTILTANTKDSKCRANNLCCHYAIAYPEELEKSHPSSSFGPLLDNDFGPVTDCRDWGKTFVRVAKGPERAGFICMHDAEESAILVKSKEWKWFPDQNKYGPVY